MRLFCTDHLRHLNIHNCPQLQIATMDFDSTMEKKPTVVDTNSSVEYSSEAVEGSVIFIDPEKEAAVRRKFDKYVVPVSVIFLVLSTLDRNNVGEAFVPRSYYC